MKRYCKHVDITDRVLVREAVMKCLKKKYRRNDTITMFSEYSGVPKRIIRGLLNEQGSKALLPLVETVVDGVRQELINRRLTFKNIWYKYKEDGSSGKIRRIGIQDVKQQIFDYIAVLGLKDILRRIGEFQCAAIKGRGQSYGIKYLRRWLKNYKIRYAGKCDIKKCYPSIKRKNVMAFLRKYVKNDLLLYLVDELLATFNGGLSIGSYLSQHLGNLFLSQLYHDIRERMFRLRKKKRTSIVEMVNLVKKSLFYMDDILLLGTNARDIHTAMSLTEEIAIKRGLKIKPNWMVFATIDRNGKQRFVDMMGTRVYRNHITIRQRVFIRIRRAFKLAYKLTKTHNNIPLWLARRCTSYKGILDSTDSHKFKIKYKVNKLISLCRKVVANESKVLKSARSSICYTN